MLLFFFYFNILSSPLMGFFLQNISFFYDPKNIILWSSYEKKNDVDNGTRNVLREWITSTVRSPSQSPYHSMQKQLISLLLNIVISLDFNIVISLHFNIVISLHFNIVISLQFNIAISLHFNIVISLQFNFE